MIKIYSKAQPGLLLHMIIKESFHIGRKDFVDPDEFIQIASLSLNDGQTFKPHQHVFKKGPSNIISQEAWIILCGTVTAEYFDVDGKKTDVAELAAGDITITLRGGHNYTSTSAGTRVIEVKTGPYTGQENDKVFI